VQDTAFNRLEPSTFEACGDHEVPFQETTSPDALTAMQNAAEGHETDVRAPPFNGIDGSAVPGADHTSGVDATVVAPAPEAGTSTGPTVQTKTVKKSARLKPLEPMRAPLVMGRPNMPFSRGASRLRLLLCLHLRDDGSVGIMLGE
jgi:hypothetical protein